MGPWSETDSTEFSRDYSHLFQRSSWSNLCEWQKLAATLSEKVSSKSLHRWRESLHKAKLKSYLPKCFYCLPSSHRYIKSLHTATKAREERFHFYHKYTNIPPQNLEAICQTSLPCRWSQQVVSKLKRHNHKTFT